MLPEPRLARQIIETLGQSGTPVSKGVSYYNAGNESLLNAIDTHYLGSYLADGGAVFKLVVGDYGSGKSHFLYCVRDRAWQRNFAVSKVELSPKESPYDDQRRVYGAVASSLMWHELGSLDEDEHGLSRFLEGTLRRLVNPHGSDLQEVIDRCREDLPGALFMYAVPPDFLHTIVPKYPALQQRIQAANYFSRANPFSPQINLEHLDVPDEELLEQIGYRLLPIFEIAYDVKLDRDTQLANIQVFSEAARNSYLAISHRRLFVKALVTEWFRQKENGQAIVPSEYASGVIKGQSEALNLLADEEQGPY